MGNYNNGNNNNNNNNNGNNDTNANVNSTINSYLKWDTYLQFGPYGITKGKLNHPFGISVNTLNGDIVIADESNHRIQIFDNKGIQKKSFGKEGNGKNEFDDPVGVIFDRLNGQIVVADTDNHRIQLIDPENGHQVMSVGKNGQQTGNFAHPFFVAQTRQTNKLVNVVSDYYNDRVQCFDDNWNFINEFGREGANGLRRPTGIAIDSRNRVFVATAGCDVKIYDLNGQYLGLVSKTGTKIKSFDRVLGLCTDNKDNLYITDSGNRRILVFDKDGDFSEEIKVSGFPAALTLDENGYLYITKNVDYQVDHQVTVLKRRL